MMVIMMSNTAAVKAEGEATFTATLPAVVELERGDDEEEDEEEEEEPVDDCGLVGALVVG